MPQSIGYFQFDNLVKGRVPFLFLNFNVDTSVLYPHIYKLHLERMSLQIPENNIEELSTTEIISLIKSKALPTHQAIVVLCEDGVKSESLANALERENYMNVFIVKGGWLKFLREQKES